MVKLYSKIYIPNLESVQQTFLSLTPKEVYDNPRIVIPKNQSDFLRQPELLELLDFYKIPQHNTGLIYYGNYGKNDPIHKDEGIPEYSINIPLLNCKDTFTSFYKVKGDPVLLPERIVNGIKMAPHYSYGDLENEKIDEFESNVPVIMHIKTPHRVFNPHQKLRIMLLIRNTDNVLMKNILADRVGFEPTVPVTVLRFSRPAQ